ncbi:MAG: aminoacyl-histidine dipeptidase [Tannerella sp.]|jgi:dipeptidase D|nr:aminoacyl-histidine dipeptidase [Tannerella sp.]
MGNSILELKPSDVWRYFYDLTQIPRPTGHMDGITKYILSFGEAQGLETKQDEAGNVLICKPATPGFEDRKIVVLQSHLDMVPQKNTAVTHDFLKDSIDACVDGAWVRARETTLGADNGIGVALMLAVLADQSLKHGPLEALFTVDEEVGMVGAFGLKPHWLQGRTLLNCDSEEEGSLFAGCAGGTDLNITFRYKKGAPLIEGDVPVKVMLTGLSGGHSGIDIHLGRANANKLMFRFLKEAIRDYGARLACIKGGSARNAIPREAVAVITLPNDNVEALWEFVADCRELWRAEYAGIETEGISFSAEITQPPLALIPEEVQDDLINAVEGCQNGVINLLHDFPGTVESSSNLAVVESSKGKIDIRILARSSSESRKEAVCSSLESVFSLAGAKVEYGNAYGGWQPDIHSPILKTMREVYRQRYGKEPAVKVIHAGLECGIIQETYPDMEMISFGPDLVYPHSPNEAVKIDSVGKVKDFLVATLEAIR